MERLECVPIILDDNITMKKDLDDGHFEIDSLKHPEVGVIQMNRLAKFIFDAIDGSSSIALIVDKIQNNFSNTDFEIVKEDVLEILCDYWKLRIVDWKQNNPFEITTEYKNYCFKQLFEEEAVNYVKKSQSYFLDQCIDSKSFLDEDSFRQGLFYDYYKFFSLSMDSKTLTLGLFNNYANNQSVRIVFFDQSSDHQFEDEVFNEFLKWAAGIYYKNFNRQVNRVDIYTTTSNEKIYNEFTCSYHFSDAGILSDYIWQENAFLDATVLSLNLS